MISRREALKSLATGSALGLTGAVIAATTSCVPTDAPAAIHDPLLEAVNYFQAESQAVYAIENEEECNAAVSARISPLLLRLRDHTPPATTNAGALAALRFVHEGMELGETICDEALLKAAIAFLEGRA